MAHPLRAIRLRLIALLRRRRQESDYDEELAFHQHMLREKFLREGTPPAQADTATRQQFGNPQRWHERLAEIRQFTLFESIARDLFFAARTLRKTPGFTLTAILTIALGIGSNTAIFSLINGLLLRPLPVPHADQLVVFNFRQDSGRHGGFSAPLFRIFEQQHDAFSDVFAFAETELQLGVQGGKASVAGALVSEQYFNALKVPPLLGRYLTPSDDVPGGSSEGLAAVISETYWRTELHHDPAIIGKKLIANQVPFTIVGVMPRSFIGADPIAGPRFYLPLSSEPRIDAPYNKIDDGYHNWWLTIMGRRKLNVSLTQANASLLTMCQSFVPRDQAGADWFNGARRAHFRVVAESGSTGFTYLRLLYRQPLHAVLGLCMGMLLLACLNLASLLFARSAAREPELATRVAIGATRRRLLQQLMVESLLLSGVGALLGLLAAPLTARALSTLLFGATRSDAGMNSLDWRVLSVTATASILAAILIGFAPALQATGRTSSLQWKGTRGSTSSHPGLVPRLLLSTQIALALLLVIGAGLISTSLVRIYRTGAGFDPHNINLLAVRMTKQPLEKEKLVALYHSLRDRIAALPTVKDASIVAIVPYSGSDMDVSFDLPGGRHTPVMYVNNVAPDYFRAMRIPLLAGRDFAWTDTAGSGRKTILSRSAANAIFPRGDAIGQWLANNQIIGIVGDVKYTDIRKPAPAEAYYPITQNDEKKPSYNFVARVDGPAAPFAAAVRAILARQAPEIPAPIFSTLSSTLDQSLSAERMMAMLSVFFAACALLVTAIGLYGTLTYRTARRTSEIGIRIALGAQRTQVVSLIFRQNVAGTLFGAVAGLVAALLAARTFASFLYGTSAHDPLVLSLATLLLALVASIASLLPAIRAARIDPLTAIRTE